MPFIQGESLRDRLERERKLKHEDALQIALEVGDALSYAHSRDALHRDIKPENIQMESGHAVIADFGIARAISDAGIDGLTQAGMVVGTPAYMSPEQAGGDASLDARSDVCSIAAVLFKMLVGEPPFAGPTPQAIIVRQLSDEVPRISAERDSVPPAVDYAVTKALQKHAADRYATVYQFTEALMQTELTPDATAELKRFGRQPRSRMKWDAAAKVHRHVERR